MKSTFWSCPVCGKGNPPQAIDANSKEAARLCLLCEVENVCLACQKVKHPRYN